VVCISPHAELDLRALLGGEMKGREGQEKKGEMDENENKDS